MAKQLALHELRRQSGTAQANQSALATATGGMDTASDKLLTGPAFTRNKNCLVGGRGLRDPLAKLLHPRAFAHHDRLPGRGRCGHARSRSDLLAVPQSASDERFELLDVKRFF